MNLSPYELALISIGGTVIGTLLGVFLTFRISILLAKNDRKHFAAQRLRDSFLPELSQLRHPDKLKLRVEHILESAFIKHQMAIDEFRFFLTEEECGPFDKAWKEYYANSEGKPFFAKYSFEFMATYDDWSPRKAAIRNIEAILCFTKDK